MKKEYIGKCYICKKEHFRDIDTWYFHDSVGPVCKLHHGVEEWYNKLLELARKGELCLACGKTVE